MRKPLIAGNWKMHGSKASVQALLDNIVQGSGHIVNAELAVFPPYVFLEQTENVLANTKINWGAQNIAIEPSGAFTGEISAGMLRDFGCHYVLVGHSERRTLYNETNEIVAAKYQVAIVAGLHPIVCVGETLQQREEGLTYQVLKAQLDAIFALDKEIVNLQQAVIAYEPVWAIGTGLTATPEMAQEVHAQIRLWIAEYDKTIAQNLRILYGGSVKRDNAAALLAMPDIDGGLIGGASLNAVEFLDIADSCNNL